MIWFRRIAAGLLLFSNTVLCALEFQYGPYFTVSGINQEKGVLTLPVENKKYKNIKVLSKTVFNFLRACEENCKYAVEDISFESSDYRKAFTNEKMLIADVSFNSEIAVTFLIFKNKKDFSIKPPSDFVFQDKSLEKDVKKYLTRLAEENL